MTYLTNKNDLNRIKYICWDELSRNKGVYEINYKFMKERMDIIREDLMKAVYHPKRLQYYLDLGYDTFDE